MSLAVITVIKPSPEKIYVSVISKKLTQWKNHSAVLPVIKPFSMKWPSIYMKSVVGKTDRSLSSVLTGI